LRGATLNHIVTQIASVFCYSADINNRRTDDHPELPGLTVGDCDDAGKVQKLPSRCIAICEEQSPPLSGGGWRVVDPVRYAQAFGIKISPTTEKPKNHGQAPLKQLVEENFEPLKHDRDKKMYWWQDDD
jgi:hypothetical protein